MNYIYVGEIVNTHGIKGELRIVSDFKYKDKAFAVKQTIYLGKRKQAMTITSYRKHKIYDMVTLDQINDINDAIIFKGDSVYITRESIDITSYVNEDIIGLEVYNEDKLIGHVETIIKNSVHEILVVKDENKKHMIPNIEEFVLKVDLVNKRINIKVIPGLLNED
ncbi:MAG: ribosome maturation factor RimM [Bacilli bacterium]